MLVRPNSKIKWEAPAAAVERWNPHIVSAAKDDDEQTSINIYSTVGEYGDGQGMTPKIVSSILRKADGGDVMVNINSPGGDFFDGLAIHTLLSEYQGKVNVRVLGMAASAASIIALAGDEISITEAAFFMIHNSWSIAIGNRHDFEEVADVLGKFDESMATLYAKATGMDKRAIVKLMDAETWIVGEDAVDQGFAHNLLASEEVAVDKSVKSEYNAALKKIDVALAKAGMPRSARRDLIKELSDTPRAVEEPPTPSAGINLGESLAGLLKQLTPDQRI